MTKKNLDPLDVALAHLRERRRAVKEIAAASGLPVVEIRAVEVDPTDFSGFPIVRDGKLIRHKS